MKKLSDYINLVTEDGSRLLSQRTPTKKEIGIFERNLQIAKDAENMTICQLMNKYRLGKWSVQKTINRFKWRI